LRIARWFVACEADRRREIAHILTEVEGELVVTAPGGPIRIRARADRIEVRRDGGLCIIDYKTGAPPKVDHVRRGLSPQLAVEALIAETGGFGPGEGGLSEELAYWHLTGGEPAARTRAAAGNSAAPADLAAEARAGIARLLAHFDDATVPYGAVPRPEIAPAFDDYEHLARTAEWRGWGSIG
jgi:ATP-dependent helicase/nuclease subunit B